MQDWYLQLADAKRLEEFCDLYENTMVSLDDESRFALMELIVSSCDKALKYGHAEKVGRDVFRNIATRVYQLLCRDFILHLHTVNYWRLPDEEDISNVFKVTPFMRKVWDDCYVSEFARFLDEDVAQDSER